MTLPNTAEWHIGKLRVILRVIITRRKCFSFFFLLYLYEKINVTRTYCGNHFSIYINQTIMLYALNLHSDDVYYFLNKLGKKVTWYFYKKLEKWKEFVSLPPRSWKWMFPVKRWYTQNGHAGAHIPFYKSLPPLQVVCLVEDESQWVPVIMLAEKEKKCEGANTTDGFSWMYTPVKAPPQLRYRTSVANFYF